MPTMAGFCVASARDRRISCCGVFEHQHRAVAVDDLAPRGGDADHTHLVAGHGGGVGLAVDDLERPQPQDEDAEEEQHDDADDAQAQVGTSLLLLG